MKADSGKRLARHMRRALGERRGAAAIEFAIICPIIFAATLGTLECGRALYERTRLSAASAAGVRALAVNGPDDDAAVRNAIEARFSSGERARLSVDVRDETIDGVSFKKIELSYDYDLLIHFGRQFSGMTFVVTRYAPAIVIPG